MTSAVLFFQIVFAKCKDRYFSGLPVYSANIDGKRVEELVTKIVSSSRRVFCLLVTYALLGNEGLSIIENLSHCGVPIPEAVKNKLEQLTREKEGV